jgi:cytochrome c553
MCVACHGATGGGDGAAAASLNPKPANFQDAAFWSERDDATVKKAIKEGGPAVGKSPLMAPLGAGLSDEQLTNLVAYLKTFKK